MKSDDNKPRGAEQVIAAINMQADVFAKIMNCFDTPAAKWLRELPLYDCPSCKKETIFKDGCVECMKEEEEET